MPEVTTAPPNEVFTALVNGIPEVAQNIALVMIIGLSADVARAFEAEEQVALTLAIVAINGWNRLAVAFRQPVGGYGSQLHPVRA